MNFRKLIQQCLPWIFAVVSALMIWKSLMILTHSETSVVVVLTSGMEPAYYRGDILFLTPYENDPVLPGDVVVFTFKGEDTLPIVHRVITSQEKGDGDFYILTKGDFNPVDDRALYPAGQYYLEKSDLMGKVRGYVPYIGKVTIFLNDCVDFIRMNILDFAIRALESILR